MPNVMNTTSKIFMTAKKESTSHCCRELCSSPSAILRSGKMTDPRRLATLGALVAGAASVAVGRMAGSTSVEVGRLSTENGVSVGGGMKQPHPEAYWDVGGFVSVSTNTRGPGEWNLTVSHG